MHSILLVDDMKHFLDLTQSFLSRAECRLLTASTGLEAIKVARTEKPDLIVLDIEMPEMNGIEACRILKADGSTKAIPIMILTSLAKEDEARRAGADDFLQKPIDEDRFLGALKKHLPIIERKDPRIELRLPASAIVGGRNLPSVVTSLSVSGAFVTGLEPLPQLADQLHLNFELPLADGSRKQISPNVVVVRRIEGKGIGVRFHELTSGAKLYLQEVVDANTEA